MRILICDDDTLITEQIEKFLRSYFSSSHIKCPELLSFCDGVSLLADPGEKDMVFLDIEMPGMNGIYVGRELKRANPNVLIFVVTSFSEYLDEAMRFHVFRYLSKPLDRQRFFRNMDDALACYNTFNIKIPVETNSGIFTFSTSAIIAVEAQGRKVIVHTIRQDLVSVHKMDYWAGQLPKNCFFQTHRSFIVNFAHVMDFDHTTIHLTEQHMTAYLARRKYSAFKNAYLLYLESTR